MDVTLIRNGYNLERRKMYLENPRHNLRSSIQLLWQQSLQENSSNQINRRKQQSAQNMKESYNRAIEKKLQEELKLNKSTFRVMPAPGAHKTIEARSSNYYDSLNRQVQSQRQRKNLFDSPVSSRDNSSKTQSLSKSVFGYDIDRQIFRKESYLSKILGDRLQPFTKNAASNMPRHQSFTINQPVSLPY